jgi:hypothetical protein
MHRGPGGEKRPGDAIGNAVEVMKPGSFDSCVRGLRADQQRLREELRGYEAGTMHVGVRPFGGNWTDITERRIAAIKGEIDSLESTIEFVTTQQSSGIL